jgi:glyoxylase-like metal-dependent hydrolase (beta-lactamase superfamily II)
MLRSTLLWGPLLGGLLFLPGALADVNVPPVIPALPPTAALAPQVASDINAKGFHVEEINGGGIFWITDGNYHSMAVVTDHGVILVDAPEPLPFFPPMPVLQAVAEITDKPITHLIYSHAHTDHIGGAGKVVEAFPRVKIIAHEDTKQILQNEADPRRPLPTHTFKKRMNLTVGGRRLELSEFGNTHVQGNIFVYAPKERILMVVDVIYPGWVPFRRLALSNDIAGWIRGHDAVLTFEFDTLVGGHLTRLGNRADVFIQKEYVEDIRNSIEEIIGDANTLFTAVAAIDAVHGAGTAFQTVAKWALFSAFYDASTMHCANVLDAKYIEGPTPGANPKALGGAETFNFSNCEAYFVARRLGVER